jgi:hypothetical protein
MLTRFMIVVDCLRYLTVTHHDHEVRRMTPRPGGGVTRAGAEEWAWRAVSGR